MSCRGFLEHIVCMCVCLYDNVSPTMYNSALFPGEKRWYGTKGRENVCRYGGHLSEKIINFAAMTYTVFFQLCCVCVFLIG